MARPMRCAAWNMVGAFIRVSTSPVVGSSMPSVRVEITDWLMARLPALATAMMRASGWAKTCSLRKVETLSRPALVRVSAIITRPSLTRIPQQYVIPSPQEPFGRPVLPHLTPLITNFRQPSNPRLPMAWLAWTGQKLPRLERNSRGGQMRLALGAAGVIAIILASGAATVARPWEDGMVASTAATTYRRSSSCARWRRQAPGLRGLITRFVWRTLGLPEQQEFREAKCAPKGIFRAPYWP